MFCPLCGTEAQSTDKLCATCGAKLDSAPDGVPAAKDGPKGKGIDGVPAAVPGQDQTHMWRHTLAAPFVGRQPELETLRAALEDTLAGQGQVVMLVGEPGIGKTRTCQELAAYATVRGAQVWWGRCHEGEGAPPYWPWVQFIRRYVQQKDSGQLRSEMGSGAPYIAEVVCDVKDKLPDLEPPAALEPEQARFRLFDSVAAFLKSAAHARPLLLALEDLHWADRSSLLLLEFLAQEIETCPLLVLGTYRDVEVSRRHPLSQTLGSLVREPRFRRMQLGGLTRHEVEQLIEGVTGTRPSPPLVEAVHGRTEGNPLFVSEVSRMLSREELEEGQERIRSSPEGVRDAIGRRLNRLSERCNQVLVTASIIGREFDFKHLNHLCGYSSEEQLLALIDEAREGHVLEELPEGRERYQFSHALVQETLASELSTSRRVRLHARIGEALETLYQEDLDALASELAYHFAEAEPAVGPAKLVGYSLLAGKRALSAYAFEEALDQFQRALAVRERQPVDGEMADLLFGLGRAYSAMLQRREAVDNLSRAFQYYAEVGDVPRAVAVASYPVFPGIGRRRVTELISRALELVPPEFPPVGNLMCRYGLSVGLELGDYQKSQENFSRALAIARREMDIALETQTLTNAAIVETFHVHWQEGVEKGLQAIELAQRVNDLQAEATARIYTVVCLAALGESDAVRYHRAAMLDLSERLRDRGWLSLGLRINALMSSMEGDWPATRGFIGRGLAAGGPRDSDLLTNLVRLEYEVGQFEQGEAHLEWLVDAMRRTTPGPTLQYALPAMVIPTVAYIVGRTDRFDMAEHAAAAVLSSQSATPLAATYARVGLAWIAVQRSDAESAGEQHAALEPLLGSVVGAANTVTDRLAGLLCMTMGRLDLAIDHFEAALIFCRRAGYRPELAWTCHDYANALLQRASTISAGMDDRQEASSLLGESLAISRVLDMRPLTDRVVSLLEQASLQCVSDPRYPDRLTQREVEVLCLIAAGKSNREIARELVISASTVAHHVTSIFTKTGAANRAEAAVYAAEHGLLQ